MHRKSVFLLFLFLAPLYLIAGSGKDCKHGSLAESPQKVEDVEGVGGGNLYLDGRVYIAGQPDEVALAELASRGVAVVVNTRTPKEVDDREKAPFDEARVVRDLGLSYVAIPLGGDDHPYEPAAVKRFAEVLSSSDGAVLVHCGLGGRAAYLWLAYLIEHDGVSLDDAMARGEAMMLKPHPLGRLLDRPTKLVFVTEPK
jgi:uncharacterized protein (TIGR01244 family)